MKENIPESPEKDNNIELQGLIKRIWSRAYLDSIEQHCDLINEYILKQNKVESPEKGKPFLTEEDMFNEMSKHLVEPGSFTIGYNAAAEKANHKIKELGKEIERLNNTLSGYRESHCFDGDL